MAINCANCRGSHGTIQQVRECHGSQAGPQATEKQIAYIESLIAEREIPAGRMDIQTNHPLSREKASSIIDDLLSFPRKPEKKMGGAQWAPDIHGETPKHGTYTVVFSSIHGDSRTTIRIRKPHPKANFAVAEYLFGPDNTSNFRRFARETEGGFRRVPAEDKYEKQMAALKALMGASEKDLAEMGFQYALASGNCYACGRKLTVPASINRGLGPICAGKA